MTPIIAVAVTLVLSLAGALGAAPVPEVAETPSRPAATDSTDMRGVAWLRDGCELLVEDAGSESATIDYWAAVCHGYAIAARDYIQIVASFAQKLEEMPLEACIASTDVTGRDVARVFVDYVDQHPEALDEPAAVAMLSAVTDRWCPGFVSRDS